MTVTDSINSNNWNSASNVNMGQRPIGKPPDKSQFISNFTDMLSTQLNLTDEQLSKIKTILQENMPDSSDNSATTGSTQKSPPDKSKINEMNEKIKSVLTDDQKTQFDSIVKKMEQNRPQPPSGAMFGNIGQNNSTSFSEELLSAINAFGAQQVSSSNKDIDFYI